LFAIQFARSGVRKTVDFSTTYKPPDRCVNVVRQSTLGCWTLRTFSAGRVGEYLMFIDWPKVEYV
jgi:hypothetical protein